MTKITRSRIVTALTACLFGLAACGPDAARPSPMLRKSSAYLQPPTMFANCNTNPSQPICTPEMGRGWNLISDTDSPSLLTCLQPYTIDDPGLVGATTTSHVEFVSSTTAVSDTMDADARVSGAVPASIPVSGSVFGDASRTVKANNGAITLMVYSKVEYAPRRLHGTPLVTDAALSTFDTNGAVAFRNLCGDRYVESVTMGGELLASIQIYTSSTSVQSKLKGALTAALGTTQDPSQAIGKAISTAGADANAQLSTSGSLSGSFQGSTVSVSIDFLQRGGGVSTNPISPQDIMDRFVAFPTMVTTRANLVPVGMGLQQFTQAANFGARSPFSVGSTTNALMQVLGPAYSAYFNAYNELSFFLENNTSNMYFAFDSVTAGNMLDDAANHLAIIEAEIDRCAGANPSPACTVTYESSFLGTAWTTLRSKLPVRKQFYTVTASDFKDAAALKGAISTKAADGYTTGGSCNIDTDSAKAAGNVRIWTASGIGGSGCRYKLFNGGSLAAPWQVFAMSSDFTDSLNTVVHMPSASDLTLELTQFSWPWHFTRGWVYTITLAGPQGDDAAQPWRDAIH